MDPTREQRVSRLIGLGIRGRLAVVGVKQVREAAKKGTLRFALVAPDASHNSLDKVVPLLSARHVPFTEVMSAEALGLATGRVAAAAVGILDAKLAAGIRTAIEAGGEESARGLGPDGAD